MDEQNEESCTREPSNPLRKIFPRQQCVDCGRIGSIHMDGKCRACWRDWNGDNEYEEE